MDDYEFYFLEYIGDIEWLRKRQSSSEFEPSERVKIIFPDDASITLHLIQTSP
jgi:hypothetical protein